MSISKGAEGSDVVTKVVPGVLVATPDAAHAAREGALRMAKAIRDALRDRGEAAIALSGGSTPIESYRLLAQDSIDWKKVHVYWIDERAVPPDHERSNYGAAKAAFLDHVPILPQNIFRLRGEAADLDQVARDYESVLRETIKPKLAGLPSLDLAVLGIGDDGHTASLFPGEPTVEITDRLVVPVPRTATREARLTLTTPVLENARSSIILVLGKSKNPALEQIWATNGSLTATPGRIIRNFRGSVTWVIDRAAGGMS